MFTDEGPAFYAAAFAHNSPYSVGSPYKTTLTSGQETAFRSWVSTNSVPFDPDEDPTDYDMRGFYKASVIDNTIPDWGGHPGVDHFPDTFKTPYDTSFSKQSQYASTDCPFDWITDPLWHDLLIDFSNGQVVFGPVGAYAPVPAGRFHLAFNQPSLTWAPTWTRIDSTPNLVVSYQIDRGRQYELDRTDTGRATVQITDTDGVLDPSNTHGPFYGYIEPLGQALICRQNPVLGTWHERFRGFIETFDYAWDPSQKVNYLTLSLVDIFEILSSIEMFPGDSSHPGFGYVPGAGPDGPLPGEPVLADVGGDQIYFPPAAMDTRISRDILPPAIGAAAADFTVVFTGNVNVKWQIYSPGESAMSAIQEAADAEFPGVSNVYTDRAGRLAIHGRVAKFDPVGVHSGAAPGAWDWHTWKIGDGVAVAASPADTVHVRSFATSLGLSKVINQAVATPKRGSVPLTNAELAGQYSYDTTGSLTRFGIRSWSANDLITDYGLIGGTSDLTETRKFADYYVQNYAWPRMRITECGFRSMLPGNTGSAELWRFLSLVDISDEITSVSIRAPGGGAFTDEPYYVEGVHETVQPLAPNEFTGFDDVTLTLDLSPKAYYTPIPGVLP